MRYTHLTQAERYQIQILQKAGHDQSVIAKLMNRHKSTISRELRRNRGLRGYRPKQAHEFAIERMGGAHNGPRVDAATWRFVDAKLGMLWSPEQISGYLKVNHHRTVSHESIYQRIYADKRAGGDLHMALRCQKARRKRYGKSERRGTIPNQISIEQRPAIVDERKRYGDWEGDLVIGAGHQQALVTLNERKSRYTLIGKVTRKTAQSVADTMVRLLTPFADCVHTLTTDNGKEFAQHEQIAAILDANFYFAHPYCSWERGANENMNGLIRQFFPKKMAFDRITSAEIKRAVHSLNHRPRKCLNYQTPHEVFMKQLKSNKQAVALQT
jgi:IS30 family transposase